MKNDKINDKNIEIINLTYQSSKQISSCLNNFLLETKNEKFQKFLLNFVSSYDNIIDECKMLIKSYNEELEEVGFFDKYQNIISLKIANLTKKSTFEIAEILYLAVCETNPKLYFFLKFNDNIEVDLIKKLLNINENFIENIKQFFII